MCAGIAAQEQIAKVEREAMNGDQRYDSSRFQPDEPNHSNEIRSITPDSNEFMEPLRGWPRSRFKYCLEIRCCRANDDDGRRSGASL